MKRLGEPGNEASYLIVCFTDDVCFDVLVAGPLYCFTRESTINYCVQHLVEELNEKHGSKYTVERLSAWAHMINMGKHSSMEKGRQRPWIQHQ